MVSGVPEEPIPSNPLGARNWASHGREVVPQLDAVRVIWRTSLESWKGHVGFFWAEESTHYHCLGGNWSNAVDIKRTAKPRFLATRWPGHLPEPGIVRTASPNGVLVSITEQ